MRLTRMWRDLASLSAVLFAAVFVYAAASGSWILVHVSDEDRFVDFFAPSIHEPGVRDAVARGVTSGVVDVEQAPSVVDDLDRVYVEALAATPDAELEEGWRTVLRQVHQDYVGVASPPDVIVTTDLWPVLEAVSDHLPADAPAVDPFDVGPVPLGAGRLADWTENAGRADALTVTGLAAALFFSGLALLASRRRSATVVLLGLVSAVGIGWNVVDVRRVIATRVPARYDPDSFAGMLLPELGHRLTGSVDVWSAVGVGLVGVLTIAGRSWYAWPGRR